MNTRRLILIVTLTFLLNPFCQESVLAMSLEEARSVMIEAHSGAALSKESIHRALDLTLDSEEEFVVSIVSEWLESLMKRGLSSEFKSRFHALELDSFFARPLIGLKHLRTIQRIRPIEAATETDFWGARTKIRRLAPLTISHLPYLSVDEQEALASFLIKGHRPNDPATRRRLNALKNALETDRALPLHFLTLLSQSGIHDLSAIASEALYRSVKLQFGEDEGAILDFLGNLSRTNRILALRAAFKKTPDSAFLLQVSLRLFETRHDGPLLEFIGAHYLKTLSPEIENRVHAALLRMAPTALATSFKNESDFIVARSLLPFFLDQRAKSYFLDSLHMNLNSNEASLPYYRTLMAIFSTPAFTSERVQEIYRKFPQHLRPNHPPIDRFPSAEMERILLLSSERALERSTSTPDLFLRWISMLFYTRFEPPIEVTRALADRLEEIHPTLQPHLISHWVKGLAIGRWTHQIEASLGLIASAVSRSSSLLDSVIRSIHLRTLDGLSFEPTSHALTLRLVVVLFDALEQIRNQEGEENDASHTSPKAPPPFVGGYRDSAFQRRTPTGWSALLSDQDRRESLEKIARMIQEHKKHFRPFEYSRSRQLLIAISVANASNNAPDPSPSQCNESLFKRLMKRFF